MIAILPKGLDKLLWERPSKEGEVSEGDWLNYTVKITVQWFGQEIIEMFVQHNWLGF